MNIDCSPSPAQVLCGLIAAAVLAAFPANGRCEWKIKQFETYNEETDKYGALAWMNEVGKPLNDAGFVQPLIEPVENDRFLIYEKTNPFSHENIKAGYYNGRCRPGNFQSDIYLNATWTKEKYWPLILFAFAHEVTHAIQWASPLMNTCKQVQEIQYPEWIVEGTASAVAFRAGELIRDDFRPRLNQAPDVKRPQSAYGLRDYSRPLDLRDRSEFSKETKGDHTKETFDEFERQAHYMSSSFWTHLILHYGDLAMEGGKPALMARILGHTLKPKADYNEVLQWLEATLKTELKHKFSSEKKHFLYHIYPQAVTEIASFGGSKYTHFRLNQSEDSDADPKEVSGEDARNQWLNEVYGGRRRGAEPCTEFSLDRQRTSGEQSVDELAEIASMCVHIKWQSMPDGARLYVEAETTESPSKAGNPTNPKLTAKELADSLQLGTVHIESGAHKTSCHEMAPTSTEKCLVKAFVKEGANESRYVKHWEVGIDVGEGPNGPAGEVYYNLSNIAPKPWLTEKFNDGQLKVRAGFCMVSAASGQKLTCPRAVAPSLGGNAMAMLGGDMRRMRYGINESAFGLGDISDVPGAPTMTGFEIETVGAGASGKRYTVMPSGQVQLGDTGPLEGQVATEPESQTAMISSAFCNRDEQMPIGQILRSDETELKLRINTDLCMFDFISQNCCPIVDHLDAEITMPFGWRYFFRSAPHDVVTPGMEEYITLFADAVDSRMDSMLGNQFGDGMNLPDTSGGDGSGNGSGFTIPGGGVLGQPTGDCDCSCPAAQKRVEDCEDVPREDLATLMECARCINACTLALMACERSEQRGDPGVPGPGDLVAAPDVPEVVSEPPETLMPPAPEARPDTCTCGCDVMVHEGEVPACQQQCGAEWAACVTMTEFPPPTAAEVAELRGLLSAKGWSDRDVEAYLDLFRDSTPAMRQVYLEQFRNE